MSDGDVWFTMPAVVDCPRCHRRPILHHDPSGYCYTCPGCGRTGGTFRTLRRATDAWNGEAGA